MGNINTRMREWLTRWSVRQRLLLLSAVAVAVAFWIAALGLWALAQSNQSLQAVYTQRMVPLQQLAEVQRLMLANRLLLESALGRLELDPNLPRATLSWDDDFSVSAAQAMQNNLQSIDAQWRAYLAQVDDPAESHLALQFMQRRTQYVNETLLPAIQALRSNAPQRARALAYRAAAMYEAARPDLEALSRMQFEGARASYQAEVERYYATRTVVVIALLAAVAGLGWLGWLFNASVVEPLKQARTVFKAIAQGVYDSPLLVRGRDELAHLLRALDSMQTRLKENENAIHHLAYFDALTQLPNRRLLGERLQHALQTSTRSQEYGALLMIDLDQFKAINDTRGHAVGDQLLVQVAQRLQRCVRQSDTVARLGGDEFVVLLTALGADEAMACAAAQRVGENVLEALQQPCVLDGRSHHPSASVGVALFCGQDLSADELFKRADASMYQAKNAGRKVLRFFDPLAQQRLEARAALEVDLHEALLQQQLRAYYQVQVGPNAEVLGAELLLRWQHPRLGLVGPQDFIGIAEECGLIVPMGEWVLYTACGQLRQWQSHPQRGRWILSVNVSPRQFRQSDFVDTVRQALADTGVAPDRLKLELTESLVLHNLHDTVQKMHALNALGVHFSMDDFGTGYSSLSQLTALPIHQLKIDRSFVRHVATNHQDAVVVQTIIAMAHALGVRVIAEGVETPAQCERLRQLGCEAFQGFLYGKPMPVHDMEAHFSHASQADLAHIERERLV
jgi:diguanylate cyclase (GGDEF)-like protein